MFVAGGISPEPAYDVEFWSCYEHIKKGVARTSNILECWHHKLNASFNSVHPNLAAFITTLSKNEQETYFNLTQMKGGVLFQVTGSDFKREFILKTLIENYENFDLDVFFKHLDRIMTFKTN